MKTKNLIFDFDGVLGNTHAAFVHAIQIAHGKTAEEARRHIEAYSATPQHGRKQEPTQETILATHVWLSACSDAINEFGFRLFDDFIEEIRTIPNTRLAVVSSGWDEYSRAPLLATRLPFTHILTYRDSHSKEEKVEWICADWGIDLQETYYFTDTTTDVLELEEVLDRKKIIGCSWGYQGHELLASQLPPEQILREFSDIHRILG